MAHMGIDSGTTNIFDEVDKNDFKTDFGSEFPVGSTFKFLLTINPLFPTPIPACLRPSVPCPMCWNDLCTDVNVILPYSLLGYSDSSCAIVSFQFILSFGCIFSFVD